MTKTNRFIKSGLVACVAGAAFVSFSANANLVIEPNDDDSFNASYTFAGNDCSGLAGQGFENCAINGSPIIAKYNTDDEDGELGWSYNTSVWSSITGAEFSVTYDEATDTWNWTYDPTAPDPLITWVVAKQGNGFTAFYLPGATSGSWDGDLSHFSFYDTTNPVPLPAAAWLLGSGLLGLFAVGRRRKAGQVVAA